MTDYRRNFIAGGSLFFTVNLAERHPMRGKVVACAQPIEPGDHHGMRCSGCLVQECVSP